MSCSIVWKPKGHGRDGGDHVVRNAVESEFGLPCTLDLSAIPFLRGLLAGGTKEAQLLIDAIETHHEIDAWKEC